MKKLLGTFFLISLAGAQIALASEDALHSSMMAISDQLRKLETIPEATPNLRAIGPLVRRVIQAGLRHEQDQNPLFQQSAYILEDYRDMVGRTFNPEHPYNLRHVSRPLAALKTAFPNPSPAIQSIQEQLQGLHQELEALMQTHMEKSVQPFDAAISSLLGKQNILPKAFLMAAMVPGHHLVSASYLNYRSSNAIAEWKAPVLGMGQPELTVPEAFAMVCPAITVPADMWSRNLASATLENLAGKSVELVLKASQFLSPEDAKAIGKIPKGLQAGKSVPGLLSGAVSNRIASHYAAKLHHVSLPVVLTMFVALRLLEQYSHPDKLSLVVKLPPGFLGEMVEGLNHWVLRPIVFKSAATACKYAVEKVLQQKYLAGCFTRLTPRLVALIPSGIAGRLSEGYKISASKAATGLATQVIISFYEIHADALSSEPAYTDFYSRGRRMISDVTLGVTANLIVGAIMPTALATLTPYVIVGGFTLYYTPSIISYGSSLLW